MGAHVRLPVRPPLPWPSLGRSSTAAWGGSGAEQADAGAAGQVLMDPVCMLTCYPRLLRNFVYKLPSLQEALGSILGLANAIRWLLARDLVIAEVGTSVMSVRAAAAGSCCCS